jgi:hypothetical protein
MRAMTGGVALRALLEQAEADTGTRASPQQKRIVRKIRGQAFQTPQGGGDGERELRPRTQARMRRDRFVNGQTIGQGQAEVAPEKLQIL